MLSSVRNRRYFLNKAKEHLSDVMNFYAYALLGNHYHFLVQVKPEIPENEEAVYLVHHKMQVFLQTYAMAYNKEKVRVGSLFQKTFKRVRLETMEDILRIVQYIHGNPQHHGLVADFREYEWTSYPSILSDKPTMLKRAEVLAWYGGRENFIRCHEAHQVELDSRLTLE